MARKELLTAVAVLTQIPAIGSMSGLPTLLNNEDVYKDPAVRVAVKPQAGNRPAGRSCRGSNCRHKARTFCNT